MSGSRLTLADVDSRRSIPARSSYAGGPVAGAPGLRQLLPRCVSVTGGAAGPANQARTSASAARAIFTCEPVRADSSAVEVAGLLRRSDGPLGSPSGEV